MWTYPPIYLLLSDNPKYVKRNIGKLNNFLPETSNFPKHIKTILQALDLTQVGLATKLGLSQGVISEFSSGTREPSKDFLLALSKIDISLDWFLTGKGEMFLSSREKVLTNITRSSEGYKVPLLRQKVSCGPGTNWDDEQNIKDYVDIFSIIPRLKLGRLFAFSVHGNSMVGAGIRNGDYVLFDTDQAQRLNDDIYVFSLDGDVFCKQLEFDAISKRVKIYSLRVADLEKAELLRTLSTEETDFADRFHIFGRVFSWIHPNLNE